MIFETELPEPGPLRAAISAAYREDEDAAVERLAALAALDGAARGRIEARARTLVEALRAGRASEGSIDSFMAEYELSSREGVVLMCLAEALLRIPDDETADRLIRDKITAADWESHLGHSDSLFVNASTWGLMLTGRVIELGEFRPRPPPSAG